MNNDLPRQWCGEHGKWNPCGDCMAQELAEQPLPLLQPGRRISSATIYTEEWCDGNGNLGPCSCADSGQEPRGHWRLSQGKSGKRAISFLHRIAEQQREACAQELERLLAKKKATAVWVDADEIRKTPIVTMEKKP